MRKTVITVALLALPSVAWPQAEMPRTMANAAMPGIDHPLASAMLARNQPEALRLIRSGISLDLSIDEDTLDELLTKRARNLSHGSNTPPGYPLAIAAALLGMPGVLEAIGEREPARLHTADSDNRTAINYAAHQGYVNCVAVLLRHGLDPLQAPRSAWASGTPLSQAVMMGHAAVVKQLLEAIPQAQLASDRVTEQVWSATFPQLEDRPAVLQTLLNAGVSPNFIAPQGGSALINAIENQSPAQVRLLIAHGAKAYSHRYRGRTAHEWAAYYAGPDGTPEAREVDRLLSQLKIEPSDWKKEKEIEEFEDALRRIGSSPATSTTR